MPTEIQKKAAVSSPNPPKKNAKKVSAKKTTKKAAGSVEPKKLGVKGVSKKAAPKPDPEITTMRVRRSTLAKLALRQQELGAASLDDALDTVLFRQRTYEAIARLNANQQQLDEYQAEAHELAEADVEVHDE